ncbi:coronin-7-like, partial [Lingula anatina]|uniref:Coronin n=1 Tax=Lingula anatina TaxID=7574 RepID=A0A1S3H0H5_LINAN
MWKFKVSKFKNTTPHLPKKEFWISDLTIANLMQSCGNHIKASCTLMAFNGPSAGGGSVSVLPLDSAGRQAKTMPLVQAHADFVSDMDFSPFNDNLLATGSFDCTVKLWDIPDGGLTESIHDPVLCLPAEGRRIENVLWHPSADNILTVSSGTHVKIWDVSQPRELYVLDDHEDQVLSMSWKGDGSLLVTSAKDRKIRIFDPRAGSKTEEVEGHANVRDSRVVWLGDSMNIASTGFSSNRDRQVILRDIRKMSEHLHVSDIDNATGTLMPLFDPDTNMLFLAGKGDRNLKFVEVQDKAPYLTEGTADTVEQIKGAAMIPKRAVDVMIGEVSRILILSQSAVVPVPYIVPRKSYTEFHADLFPDTNGGQAAMTAEEWCAGENKLVEKISLDPSKRKDKVAKKETVPPPKPEPVVKPVEPVVTEVKQPPAEPVPEPKPDEPKVVKSEMKIELKRSSVSTPEASKPADQPEKPPAKPSAPAQPRKASVKPFKGVRLSKFRYLKGTPAHKSQHIENIRNSSTTVPGESDAFHANKEVCAVPLRGAGGLIAICELNKPGRLPDAGLPVLQHGNTVMDFMFDPFNNRKLAVATIDAKICIWTIPDEGLTETLTEPTQCLYGHREKIYFIRYHPLAENVLVSGSYDMTIRLWNLETNQEMMCIDVPEHMFCLAWSGDGKKFATVSSDKTVRIYEPRVTTQPIQEGPGPAGHRGARVCWACQDKYLAVSGFNTQNTRIVSLYDTSDLAAGPLNIVDYETTPSILVMNYDEGSSTIFLTGRGDSVVHALEVSEDEPHLFQLSDYRPEGRHQALAFLPKSEINVREVEFAKALRFTGATVEPVSFTVPRVKPQFFQDDLFPDTRVTWEPCLTAEEWFRGEDRVPRTISLRPPDMEP